MCDSIKTSTLHLIQNSMTDYEFERQTSRFVRAEDKIVFIGDSTFQIKSLEPQIIKNKLSIYAIDHEISSRSIDSFNASINIINFDQFVNLTIESNKIISW